MIFFNRDRFEYEKKLYIAILTLILKLKGMANEHRTNSFFSTNRFFTYKTISKMC